MKTEMSIPNPVYHRSQQLAQQLDLSLSEFFVVAVKNYLELYSSDEVTRQLNAVYATESSPLAPEFVHLQATAIGQEPW